MEKVSYLKMLSYGILKIPENIELNWDFIVEFWRAATPG